MWVGERLERVSLVSLSWHALCQDRWLIFKVLIQSMLASGRWFLAYSVEAAKCQIWHNCPWHLALCAARLALCSLLFRPEIRHWHFSEGFPLGLALCLGRDAVMDPEGVADAELLFFRDLDWYV